MNNLGGQQTKRTSLLSCLLAVTLTALLMSHSAWAQTGAGSISGTVRDANRAVVPGADVTATQTETNLTRKTISSDVGSFHIGALTGGPYAVSVVLPGFKKWVTHLTLQVGENLVVNPVLEVGEIQSVVEVTGVAPPITLESIDVSDVKDYTRIRQLPLNGRAISSLFDLTPGVEGGGSPRVNGLKVGSVEMTLDGLSLVDRFGGGMARVQPGLDTIQEFRIETVGSDARYSRPATVTLATRSGTNVFHGSLFETHRNNTVGLLSRRREEAPGSTAAHLVRNEFGASAGGPFYLGDWYDGRDKTFWFFAYEGLRNRASNFVNDVVPTEAMWNGDLSNIVDASGRKTILYDPLTTGSNAVRQPFPNNLIPANRIHPMVKIMKELTAKPTNNNNPYLSRNFQHFYPDTVSLNTYTFKGNHTLTQNDNLSVRWTRSTRSAKTEGGVFGNPAPGLKDALGSSRSDAEVNNVGVNYVKTFSPSLLNELLIGAHRSFKSSGTLADFTDWPSKLGLPNPFGADGWPTLYAGPVGYWDSDNRKDEALTAAVLENNTTWNRGRHTLQFGGKIRFEHNNVRELQQAQGSHDWDGSWSALYSPEDDAASPFTGEGFASFLLGLPTFLSNQFNRGYFYFRQIEAGLYFNDKWNLTPRLTLNLGLRWDKWTPYHEKFNRMSVADIQAVANQFAVVTPKDHRMEDLPGIPPAVIASWSARGLKYVTAREVGMPDNLFRADNNNFGPRLGAAFKITNKTVLRGGYGEYFWTMPLSQILQSTRNNPPLNLRFTTDVYGKNANFNYPLVSRPSTQDFIGQATVDTKGVVRISPRPASSTVWDARNWKEGRAQSWHVTLEHELPFETAMRLSYIGEHGRDLEQQFDLNTQEGEYNYVARTGQAPPGNRALLRRNKDWNFIGLNRTGYSNTHSGQIEVERRFSSGVAFQWFYTYTRSLTTSDAGGFTSGNVGINSTGGGGRVPENHLILGSPNLSYDERLRLVYFNSTNIPPHRVRYNGIVDLPFGRGKPWGSDVPAALEHVIGGWQIAFIGDWRGGLWRSVSPGRYVFGDPTLKKNQRLTMIIFGRPQRLWFRGDFSPTQATNVSGGDLTALVPVDRSQRAIRPLGPNFDNRLPQKLANGQTRFTPIGELYNPSPRAFYSGPGAWNVDLALFKHFRVSEGVQARVSADFFNFFNHPNDVDPNSITGLQDLSRQSNSPRTIQFSARLDW